MNNLLSIIVEYKIIVSAIISGIIYNFFKQYKISLISFSITMMIIRYFEKYIVYEKFKIFQNVTDRNFFCKAIDKVATKCQGNITKNDCSKGIKCNDCEKFNYHLSKTKKLLNSIISKNM